MSSPTPTVTVPRLLVAGTHSGVGKTSVAVGLMAALRRRGLTVAPFKIGPDYLDPGYHQAACGRASAPLDLWMLGEEGACRSLIAGAEGADLAVVEGMMGLHDGAGPDSDDGSTAKAARVLGIPTVLVLDGSAMARSAGAVALGYRLFDPEVPLAGVIANRIAGEGHARYLRPGVEGVAGLPFLGWLPSGPALSVPERHLGLQALQPGAPAVEAIDRLADAVELYVDVDRLLELARAAPSLPAAPPPPASTGTRIRIGVARDAAFCFYYPDNLALLQVAGAELVPFSPCADPRLPAGLDGIYLGGGYPELHCEQLAANREMLQSVRRFVLEGGSVYAECGGMMYLGEAIVDLEGRPHAMGGLVPGRSVMTERVQAIGYREVSTLGDTCFGPAGTILRGHEFRYSRWEGESGHAAFQCGERRLGYARGSLLASYVHLHFGSNPAAARRWMDRCRSQTRGTGP